MPELPEVETTRLGIAPHLTGRRISAVVVRQPRLRWPVPETLSQQVRDRRIIGVARRGKYLLLDCGDITILMHLGMSGSLRIVEADRTPRPHDHVDLVLDSGKALRLHDPRRFGAVLCFDPRKGLHPLLSRLGPEPLGEQFDGDYLYRQTRRRRTAVKGLIMDSHVVVGVGNIYASESLFLAGIRPRRASGRLTRTEAFRLVEAIRTVLTAAIEQGGTTLRDFVHEDGSHGYFSRQLRVYGRAGLPCLCCGATVRQVLVGQRSTFYCPACQRR
ncbi:bifunctional DNA-formamidopyrimidine glycosylase/DNA-(apurinic or apyrimidinic site) lyase [Ectothiorhodospira lacustris]|uniref:bifunctional DNA-formamidopyrimidine glycosylase/DNA-(apurinic or apyrimidinic site) lyase n=1 Tax=Ectothiorhodospira lacustris TaxID=2899127 RepID=UPI001EE925AA|nr:bifunctional DNA-formamidopyrimidine glycosylase/DNA-(apurinic or apyrimidinic site) lyase [Ectothiorhodospira lacustris]MCG5510577.1 bifunctional DNA-formamidopyrimidine glycosylase/DNA-(apurinic or apyrimidinic site) lyase [Ectothiorhodospira lacustris]MCG5521269.1 bifunctional DNA-formamidopyrimidine glycosylase/DNA-(apurinic or apyrimidinic site) lyase [Ectothiorhodospira lacustris]